MTTPFDHPDLSIALLQHMMAGSGKWQDSSHESALLKASDALMAAGAQRVRYYQLASESVPQVPSQETLFLTSQVQVGDIHSAVDLGFQIPLHDASIYKSIQDGSGNPIQESSKTCDAPWVARLGLNGCSWIDVLVRHQDRTLGLLAFDWTGELIELDPHTMNTLRIVGELLGFQLAASSPALERRLERSLGELYLATDPNEGLVPRALEIFQDRVEVASVSLFRHDWTTETLQREYVRLQPSLAPKGRNGTSLYGESPYDVGEYLTGKAWSDPQYRQVLDFAQIQRFRPELVSKESEEFHSRALSGVHSIMYATLGAREPRLLLRVINDATEPRLPFIRKFGILQEFARDLSPLLDAELTARRTNSLSKLKEIEASLATSGLMRICEAAENELTAVEGISRSAFIVSRETPEGTRPHFLWGVPQSRHAELIDRIENSSAWSSLVSRADRPTVIRRQDSGPLATLLGTTAHENADIAVVSVRVSQSRVIAIFPVWNNPAKRLREGRLWTDSTIDYISQVVTLIAHGAETTYLATQAEGALNALSLVGHEMMEPLSAVRNLALHAFRSFDLHARGVQPLPPGKLANWKLRYERQSQILETSVRLGWLVGRQADGQMAGIFRKTAVLSTLYAASGRTYGEIEAGALLLPRYGVRIVPPPSTDDRALTINCDEYLVQSALLNILRNAVKYSISPEGRCDIFTHIREVRGGSFVDISVTSTGVGIDPFKRRMIFDAFQRAVDNEHVEVSLRGMGLGLYLANQIGKTHGGSAFLAEHVPDAKQNGLARSVFVLRLATNLEAGPYPKIESQG